MEDSRDPPMFHVYESKKEGKDQESIQSRTTPDPGYQWESKSFNKSEGIWAIFANNNTSYLDFLNFDFNSEQLTTIYHSSRQDNLQNNARVGLLWCLLPWYETFLP